MSSWGALRLQLQTSAPGVSLDLLDAWIRARYDSILSATDWQGLKAHSFIRTVAAHESGAGDTVTVTVGSAAVAGAGTAWDASITGLRWYVPGDTVTYEATYVSPVALTLDRPYEGKGREAPGTVFAASPYVLMQNLYHLPDDCSSVVTILDPITERPLNPFSKDGLDESAGPRTLVGYPKSWAPYDDTPEPVPPAFAPPVRRIVELFPPPRDARGFPLEYLRLAFAFDGQNTSAAPLPFVTDACLLFGVRADIAVYLEKLTQATGYEAQFEKELARMLLKEHSQRRVKVALHMASRFTRHRLGRISRGLRHGWGQGSGGAT